MDATMNAAADTLLARSRKARAAAPVFGYVDVPAVTRTHAVLLAFGHRVTRQTVDGVLASDAPYCVLANPARCGRFGEIPEADWAAADAAEAAHLHGPLERGRCTIVGADGRECLMYANTVSV